MKRKLLLLLVALLPIVASAYDAQIDGIYYYFSGDNATVTCQVFDDIYYTYVSDYSGEVVIPESVTYGGKTYSVTSIGDGAFYECSGLTSITIPGSVTSIGDAAFYDCWRLTSVTIPNSVTSIGDYAFAYCISLTSVTIPNSVTSIGYQAFYGCSGLTSVTIPNSVTSIGDYVFAYCISLTSVTIGNSVTSIGYQAFYNCSGLTSITIPNSVTNIGSNAFQGCSGLTSITIPSSVTSIGNEAFRNCSSMTSIKVETGNTTYDSRDNCNAIIETATNTLIAGCQNTTIPSSVTSIGRSAFRDCTKLTSITIPNSVTSIGQFAFYGCSSLTSITIPNSVTSIGEWAFSNCTSLTSVTIPNSVTSIGRSVFSGCSGLTSVTIPNSVTSISSGAFMYCRGLTSITIPNSVTSISDYAFSECTSLTSITIPNSVTSIGSDAFSGCKGLTSITIPNSVTSIGDYAFSRCRSLTSITIPNSVTSIGGGAFYNCTSLTSITIPNSVTSIGGSAFSGCSGLTAITIGTGIKDIGNYAFASCKELTDVYCFSENVPNTKANAFSDSSIGSATLHVPASSISSYSTTKPWSEFGKIVSSSMTYTLTYMIDGQVYKTYIVEYGAVITPEPAPTKEGYTFSGWSYIPPTMPATDVVVMGTFTKILKCATPTISYANGELKFNSETEGVTFHYDIDIADDNIKNGISDKVQLSVTYHISVYATREDYYDSEVATGTLCWIDQQPSTEGIVAEDAVNEIKALPVLIQAQAGFITLQGLEAGTEVSAYNTSGMLLDTIVSSQDTATLRTNLPAGSTAIVKIGQRAVKVMVK